jgi:branched-chain amino acid transport system ATP-binding protein
MNGGIRRVALLQCKGLGKRFGGVQALASVDISVRRGTIVGLIGPNGAGKTTLFNVIAGTFRPNAGRVFFEGEDVTGFPANVICRCGIARTFQVPRPFGEMTCLENVGVAIVNAHGSGRAISWRKAALEKLAYVGLEAHAGSEAKHLNVVQKKRLEIARALATQPKMLMLDEVLGGLNTQEIAQAVEFIRKLRDEMRVTVFWIEHVMGAIMSAADRVIVLDQGKKLMDGTPEKVVNDPSVIQAYLGE